MGFLTALGVSLLSQSSSAQKHTSWTWSEWSDHMKVKNHFVERHGELYASATVKDIRDECSLLNLEPVVEVRGHNKFYVALAGGMVCAIAITASVTATYVYSRR